MNEEKTSHAIDRAVGQRVRILRIDRGLSQSALADALGVSFQQVQKYEKGINRISASTLHKIGEVLLAPVAAFFVDSGDPAFTASGPSAPSLWKTDFKLLSKLEAIKDRRVKRHLLALISLLAE